MIPNGNPRPVQSFEYRGSMVTIALLVTPKGTQYWWVINNRTVNYSSNLDTAKRHIANFIDVCEDAHYGTNRKNWQRAVGTA